MAGEKKEGWLPLKKGSLIDVIAPGFRPTDQEVEAGLQFLESWGFKPRLPQKLFGPDILSSNSDKARADQFLTALASPSSDAIWCLRGGYGSIRLLPFLKGVKKSKKIKPILGLSDVTTLQQFIYAKWGYPSLQAPLLDRLARLISPELAQGRPLPLEEEASELRDILLGEISEIEHAKLQYLGNYQPKGLVRGIMAGGNLLTYASSVGTSIHPNTVGQILYFEDVGERGYRVDRWLTLMSQSQVLTKKTKAIIFGEFVEGDEPKGGNLIADVLKRFACEWGDANRVPVMTGILSGHGRHQRVVPIGTRAVLNSHDRRLNIQTGCVSC